MRISRRKFISITSEGIVATLLAPGVWSLATGPSRKRPFDFTPYRKGETLAAVTRVTPDDGFYVHTFYDECPWSPDKKFLAVTRLPYQKKKPLWGDAADVCVIDLENQTIETVYTTRAWSFQLGANPQWADNTSRYLYTNDIIDGQAVCVRIDLKTHRYLAFAGPKYDLSPDGRWAIGPDFNYVNITQYGYTVPDPPGGVPRQLTKSQMDSEGLWMTHLEGDAKTEKGKGENKDKKYLLASMNDFYRHTCLQDKQFYRDGVYYAFHSKFNRSGNRIMMVFRCLFNGKGRHASLFTLNKDGSNIIQCLPREKWNRKARLGGSGNHPNWHPDGEHIIMNTIPTWLGYKDMMLTMFKYDGSDFRVLTDKFMGSGHPSVEPATRYLVTDAYLKQTYVVKGNEIPIRLIDLKEDREHILCTISNNVGNKGKMYSSEGGSQFKLDPHPAWSRDYRQLCINGAPEGRRQVFIVDLKNIV